MGANLLASASREQMAYTVDVLRTHLPEATELLLDAVLNPKFELHTLSEALDKLKGEVEELEGNAQASLMEALHAAAYDGGLGQPLVASPGALARLTPAALAEFVAENYTANRIALAVSGASLAAVSTVAEPLLAALPSGPAPPKADGAYVGGDLRKPLGGSGGDGLTHVALAFHFPGGWRDVKGATCMTVLQMLLGGGNSFSAGGPGKGMHSRLYSRVLNRHAWAHSCTGFHSLYNDTGLVGIHASCSPGKGGALVDTLAGELLAVAKPGGITPAELARAKAATVSSVLMNLESRAVVAEDIGRQALTYGARKPPSTFLDEVARITEKDVATAVTQLLKSTPTFVALGDTAGLPRPDNIAKRFG
jgi:processing peptidase subunit alpha